MTGNQEVDEPDDIELYVLLEKRGYKKWEIEKLDDWYIYHILYYPQQEKIDFPIIKPKGDKKKIPSHYEAYRKRLLQIGVPNWYVEKQMEEFKQAEIKRAEKERQKAAEAANPKPFPSSKKKDESKSVNIVKKSPKKKKR